MPQPAALKVLLKNRLKDYLVLTLPIVLAVSVANAAVSTFLIDDAYITFRYAQNLIDYGSLYYNPTEEGPYGYSNPSYVFLLAALEMLSFKQVSLGAISRVIASLALGAMLFVPLKCIADRLWKHSKVAAFSIMLVCGYLFVIFPFFLPNFFSGLETPVFTFLLFVMLVSLFIRKTREALFLLSLAAALTLRVDASIVLLPLVAAYAIFAVREAEWGRVRNLGFVLVAVVALFFLHFFATGTAVPLSFGHKSHSFDLQTLIHYVAFALVALSPLGIILFRRGLSGFLVFISFYTLYVSLFYCFFIQWPFYRYIFPFVFSAFVAMLVALFRTWERSDWPKLVLVALYTLFAFLPGTLDGFSWVAGYRAGLETQSDIVDAFERADVDKQHRVFASYDAGYVAYKTGWRIIDLQGLTTPEVRDRDMKRVISEEVPTVLIVSTWQHVNAARVGLTSQYHSGTWAVPDNYRFAKHIPLTNKYWWPKEEYSYYIFVNKDAPKALLVDLRSISFRPKDIDEELGYQRHIIQSLGRLERVANIAE